MDADDLELHRWTLVARLELYGILHSRLPIGIRELADGPRYPCR